MNTENIFMVANILFTFGTLLLFSKVFKNRNMLNDFDLYGSVLTTIALFCMLIGYIMLKMYLPFLFAIPTTLFWLYVSVHTLIRYNT